MKNRWDDAEANQYAGNPLGLRVYTSRLLGQESSLVLHGGGNTSVKIKEPNFFGEPEELLYVKGSGWDLGTIEAAGFAPVRLDVLKRLATLDQLTDTQMVRLQRSAMTDPNAPTPSVEALLHAIIPFQFVDHTHADAVVAITNSQQGPKIIREIFADRTLIVPYVMPGFVLAKHVYEMTQGVDWDKLDGMILMNHGVFTFGHTARDSYERMIRLVSRAEDYLEQQRANTVAFQEEPKENLEALARIRRAVCDIKQTPMLARLDSGGESVGFASLSDMASIATQGPLTPDHVIRTKRIPVILGDDPRDNIQRFAQDYRAYFARHASGQTTPLDAAPRWAVWPGYGTLAFGHRVKDTEIVSDIVTHTIRAIQWAQALGGWKALSEKELFSMEYWELEQAKLRQTAPAQPLQGKVALVTGGASGIGRACADRLRSQGAAVGALDITPGITDMFHGQDALGIVCDVTDSGQINNAVDTTVRRFGGLDILVSNAGTFPPSESIEGMHPDTWNRSLALNLSSHQWLLQACIPYLKLGIDPTAIMIASKNVPAPGPGAAAYSVAKAGLTQLARVAALEWGAHGVRVNVIHPNAVFDTAVWTPETLKTRAKHYGMSIEAYKKNNVLGVEVTSKDVAVLACTMAGDAFAKTTGAQIPIDGGNERVI